MSKQQVFILMFVFLGFIFLYGLRWKNANVVRIHTPEEQRHINAQSDSNIVDFIYTEQEQRDIAKWKNKTMDDVIEDANNGDRAAIHNLGIYFLLGINVPINVSQANEFFAKSASLGFAPALNQIAQMYINDESNAFLGLVYKNLTISFGHTEFTRAYHESRNKIIEKLAENGQRIFNEIEIIAAQKKSLILKNQKYIQDKQNKNEELYWVILESITDKDYQYDNDYWLDVYNGDNEIVDFSDVKERDKIYLEKLHGVYYQSITSDAKGLDLEIQKIINDMQKDSYSKSEIETLKRQAKAQAKKNYKFVCKIESDAQEAEKKLKILEQYKNEINGKVS